MDKQKFREERRELIQTVEVNFLDSIRSANRLYSPLFVWVLQEQETSLIIVPQCLAQWLAPRWHALDVCFILSTAKCNRSSDKKTKWIENILTPSNSCQGFRGHVLNGLDIWWSNIKIETPVGFFKTEVGRKRSRSNPWNPCRNIIKKRL